MSRDYQVRMSYEHKLDACKFLQKVVSACILIFQKIVSACICV